MAEMLMSQAVTYFFHLALVGLCGAMALIWKRIQAMQLGMQMLLMDRLMQEHDHYVELGYMPLHKKAAYKKKHDAYLGLGVNGILDQPYEEVMKLPTKEK